MKGERPRGIGYTVLLTTSLKTVANNHWLSDTYPIVCIFCLIPWTASTTSANSTADPHEIENDTDLGGKDPITERCADPPAFPPEAGNSVVYVLLKPNKTAQISFPS